MPKIPSSASSASKSKLAKPARPKAAPEPSASDFAATEATLSPYKVGDHVRHQMFGPGEVLEVHDDQLVVEFDKVGAKRIRSSFVDPSRH